MRVKASLVVALALLLLLFGCVSNTEMSRVESPPTATPTAAATTAADPSPNATVSGILVSRVVDGDTLVLATGERVRLIGINAPESDRPFGGLATDTLRLLVEGKTVYVWKDVSETDAYGRLLRYVALEKQDINACEATVNYKLVEAGVAMTFAYGPDVQCIKTFEAAQKKAEELRIGMWTQSVDGSQLGACLTIVEFHYDAAGNDAENLTDEYFALRNDCTETIDLTGWTVSDEANAQLALSPLSLHPNAKITVYTGSGTNTETAIYWSNPRPVWNNDKDTLFLRDRNGNLQVKYSYP